LITLIINLNSINFNSVSVNLLVQQHKFEFKSQHKYATTEYKTQSNATLWSFTTGL